MTTRSRVNHTSQRTRIHRNQQKTRDKHNGLNLLAEPDPATIKILASSLLSWYKDNHRDLPWRRNRKAYSIWISEVMLQQTTVAAVIPYYEKFMACFPSVKDLAQAQLDEVYEQWAGLGYYSRARNLHKSAQILAKKGFPKMAADLQELPGFGPYTSRAVSSIAFDEPVGVLDGNVIRVLCRVLGWSVAWWKTAERACLQKAADQLAQQGPSHLLNQGLMELGATVCTPASPNCLLCPWSARCEARKQDQITGLPLKKPRKSLEVWVWTPQILMKNSKVALVKNDYAPFLKGQMIFPGSVQKQSKRPKTYDLKHGITHHDIYIQVQKPLQFRDSHKKTRDKFKDKGYQWVQLQGLKKINPSNVLQKILQHFLA
ncbi:MAG: A/G-specific adenine glycosylase [Bdellovibrio sp. CG10_big_fil_rev_8_21_14_0_10_47_8]|nr:MAG: A/G-specific adenine glycosylase [Bdellovibrio sp. CG10_big_fil_rev_8_21_14_0_10_47_8]